MTARPSPRRRQPAPEDDARPGRLQPWPRRRGAHAPYAGQTSSRSGREYFNIPTLHVQLSADEVSWKRPSGVGLRGESHQDGQHLECLIELFRLRHRRAQVLLARRDDGRCRPGTFQVLSAAVIYASKPAYGSRCCASAADDSVVRHAVSAIIVRGRPSMDSLLVLAPERIMDGRRARPMEARSTSWDRMPGQCGRSRSDRLNPARP